MISPLFLMIKVVTEVKCFEKSDCFKFYKNIFLQGSMATNFRGILCLDPVVHSDPDPQPCIVRYTTSTLSIIELLTKKNLNKSCWRLFRKLSTQMTVDKKIFFYSNVIIKMT